MSNETSPPLSSPTGLVHLLITTKILRDGDLNLRNKWRVKICPIWVLYCLNFTIKPDLKMETPKLSLNLQLAPPETCKCDQQVGNVCKRVPITGFRSLFQRPRPYFRNHVPISGTTSLFQGPGPNFRDQDTISETRSLFQGKGLHCRYKVLLLNNQVPILGARSLFWGPGPYFRNKIPILVTRFLFWGPNPYFRGPGPYLGDQVPISWTRS